MLAKWLHLHSTISEFSHLLVRGSGHAILFHAVNVISIYLKCLLTHVPYLFHQIPSNIFHNNFSMFIVFMNIFFSQTPRKPPAQRTTSNPHQQIPKVTLWFLSGVPPANFLAESQCCHTSGPLGTRRLAVNVVVARVCGFVAEVKTTGFRIAMGKQQSRNFVPGGFFWFCFVSFFVWLVCLFFFWRNVFFLLNSMEKK